MLELSNQKKIDCIITTGGTGLTGRDTTTEAIEEPKTNHESLYELVLLAKSINTDGAYKDPLFIEILKEAEEEICNLYHLVLHPIPTPQSSNV